MNKKPQYVETIFDEKKQTFAKVKLKAAKGKRIVAVNQNNQICIIDDRGNVVAVKQ